jgi:hypothetical protein
MTILGTITTATKGKCKLSIVGATWGMSPVIRLEKYLTTRYHTESSNYSVDSLLTSPATSGKKRRFLS